jgi:hypothetical protein
MEVPLCSDNVNVLVELTSDIAVINHVLNTFRIIHVICNGRRRLADALNNGPEAREDMARGDDPEDARRPPRGEEDAVRPEELDYTVDRRVAELREGRYVVATDEDGEPNVSDEDQDALEDADEERSLEERGNFARQQMARYVSDRNADHGFAVTAAFEGTVTQRERFSDDVATAFGDLVRWYADQVDAETPPAEVLGILLLASDVDVAFPTKVLAPVLKTHGLTPDDSIGELIEALEGDGLRIPPRQ